MLKKEIEYEDVDGNEVKKTFYFALNRAEMAEIEVTFGDAGLEKHFASVVASGNRAEIFKLYKFLLSRMVGRREGNLFIKDEEVQKEFLYSGAYDAMFVQLFQDPTQILTLFREALPNKSRAAFDKAVSEAEGLPKTVVQLPAAPDDGPKDASLPQSTAPDFNLTEVPGPQGPADGQAYSMKELVEMPQAQFNVLFGTDHKKWPRTVLNAAFQRKLAAENNQ